MSIRTKILCVSLGGILLTAAVLATVVVVGQLQLKATVASELDGTAKSECAKVAQSMLLLVRTQQENSQMKLRGDTNLTAQELARMGAVTLDAAQPTTWNAINQTTKAPQTVALPTLRLGDQALAPTFDPQAPVPVVDKVTATTGSTCTIFQRMNDQGDMLRVATTVMTKDGKRAVGTYIPAVDPDGTPNAVVAAILQNHEYNGRAKVVDNWCLTNYRPLLDEQKRVIGMIYTGVKEESVGALRQGIMKTLVGKTGYVYVLGGHGDMKGRYIISKGGQRDGESILDARDAGGNYFIREVVDKALNTRDGTVDFVTYPWQNPGENQAREKVAAVTYYPDWDWVIAAGAYKDDFKDTVDTIQAALTRMLAWTLGGAGAMLLLVGVCVSWLTNGIVRPIRRVVERIKDIAQGEGDLTKRVEVLGHDEVGELARWFNEFVQKVHDVIAQVTASTREVAGAATQIAAASEEMAQGLSSQTQQVNSINASVEEMSQSVVEVARKSTEATTQAQRAGDKARQGGAIVNTTLSGIESVAQVVQAGSTSVAELGQRSAEIGRIVAVINDIADQTNLLALNAAIEAARAGEHGRGFAVVADEVRKLADRTTKATEEIAGSIRAIQSQTDSAVGRMQDGTQQMQDGVAQARGAGKALEEIVAAAQQVSDMIRSIATAAEEQSSTSVAITQNVATVQSVIEQVNQSAAQSAQAAADLSRRAETLRQLLGQFKLAA